MNLIQTHLDNSKNLDAFKHIPRFCYRKNFQKVGRYNSDTNWGCCYRSAQGILAQYFILFKNKFPQIFNSKFGQLTTYELFLDSFDSPFSIQNLAQCAVPFGIGVGNWAKPSTVANSISTIMKRFNLSVVIIRDFLIQELDLEGVQYPLLLMIPGLFGLNTIDLQMTTFLKACLCTKGSLGFVSGKKNSAYYIVGFEGDDFIYFDPHVTKVAAINLEDAKSFFELPPKKMKGKNLNPSILIGFMVENQEDLRDMLMILLTCDPTPLHLLSQQQNELANQIIDIDELDKSSNS
ncbi:Clan CA, family C54, ATG4-like cysteine peptidase [Histomonas meleagridis]|uniref:Clan CA, family C54, ATG4-like cysteine peptidase n=1 Tax=Histomonas meleagridis TaxID=135588 RepID=UPI003559650D|nr:Clan CA, family C54, ATG4-like cysteine peptidase [Histomonas meleagridis]KAH0799172.1 Clan CA, family C54, ATG4-like cysteine peptidase [Histomonas meleagridis]